MRNGFLFKGRGNTSLVTEVDVHVDLRFMYRSPLYVYISALCIDLRFMCISPLYV